jgi:putative hydrolase of the HAD superfamily
VHSATAMPALHYFCGMYEHLFFDLDHTLWDFETNSRNSFEVLYPQFDLQQKGVSSFDAFMERYMHHNDVLWDRYRKGFIKQDELRWKRVWHTLLDFKIGSDQLAKDVSQAYLELLPTRTALFDGCIELLNYLQNKQYKMHLLTNGFQEVQLNKIKLSGIADFFEQVITSEASNSVKPNKAIFDYALEKTGATVANSIMIGDNLEVDIEGAANAGWPQIWVNHTGEQTTMQPTHVVTQLSQLKLIL